MNRRLITGLVASAALVLAFTTYELGKARAGGIPQTNPLAYSGTLLNNGQPDNGSHFILFKLWAGGNPTTPACTTIPSGNTQLANGRFTIPLDPTCLPVIHQNADVQIEVVVDGTSMGLAPLSAVPYAVEADTASNFSPGSSIAALVPPGTVVAYAGVAGGAVTPPPGWLLCDGSAVSRTTYPNLFKSIGTTAGGGDGATTFNLPDYRGTFLRGVDHGAGRDPDAAGRIPMASGGNTGDAVGTIEGGAVQSHNHGVSDPGHGHNMSQGFQCGWGNWSFGGNNWECEVTGNQVNVAVSNTTGISVQNAGGAETRPTNAAVNYLIKY